MKTKLIIRLAAISLILTVLLLSKTVSTPASSNLIDIAKTNGCLWSGLLDGAGDGHNVQAHLDDEFIPMLARSRCLFLHRSVETWAKPPDFAKIRANIQRIKTATGKDYIYEIMLAEAIPTAYKPEFGSDYSQFDFSAMCADSQPVDYGRPQNCIPSFAKPEYRRYLQYITQQAIDSGIQSFLFGQVYFQDPNWSTQPLISQTIQSLRDYAAGKDVSIIIGAQTNHISTSSYLQNFDYIQGGIFFDDSGTINFDSQCKNNATPNPNGNPWWDCAAHLWHDAYRNSAQNVLVTLDHESTLDDDIHRFARLSKSERAALLSQLYSYMKSKNAGFVMPFLVNLSSNLRGDECYGLYPWIYSAANSGGSERSDLNPRAYSCQDEDTINQLLPSLKPTLSWHDQQFTFPAGDNVFSIPQHDRRQSLDHDVVVTKATLHISGITPGTLFDTGINFNRYNKEPIYRGPTGGYTEIFGLNVNRLSSSDDWSITIDLTDTPLYLPKETEIVCTAVAYGVNDTTKSFLRFNCDLEYQDYITGSPRFRILRFPYSDQTSLSDGSMAVSYYRSSRIFPLHIKAMNLFQSFGGDSTPATMTNACLKWLTPDKSLIQEQCFSDQSVSPGQDNPTHNIISLDWNLNENDLLGASCDNARPNTDCAIWAFAEIPGHILNNPSAIFKDFGNIPRQSLINYCQENIDMLTHPFYCDYQTSCDRIFKLNQCQNNLFPSALIAGDINTNGGIDIFDYNLLVADFGKTGELDSDINLNGQVDIFDYNLLVANFGKNVQ